MVAMQQEIENGRLVRYHRSSADEQFGQAETFGERYNRVFVDQDMSVDASRPELQKMIGYLEENDVVAVESLCALGYCFSDLQSVVKVILDKGCSIRVVDEDLVFSAQPELGEQSALQLLSAFGRVEKRMLTGLMAMTRAEAQAQKEGTFKSNARSSLAPHEVSRLREMKKAGVEVSALQEEFNLSRGAIHRLLV